MDFYSATDYRKILTFLVEREKGKGIDCNFSKVAEAIRVQRPYLSKVMNGAAELSEDQMHLVCEFFDITGDEKDYLDLLLQFSKSGLKERKDFLKKQIYKMQAVKLDIKNNLDVKEVKPDNLLFNEYFLNPHMQIVHVALNIKRFQHIDNLTDLLNINSVALADILRKLETLKLIEFKNNRYVVINQTMHLPKNSNLLHPHQALLRVKSIEHQQNKSLDSGNYAFSVTFSADEEARKKIQEDFLKYLKSVQKTVQNAGTEEVYQINFDLFSWTK
jgi:uncharacterized protein (TIGR02147 family)